jgi:flagellar assembly factor FliW
MKIKNIQFGEMEIDQNMIIQFSEGIIGFEDYKRFILVNVENGIFFWLTCVDEPDLVFPIFPTRLIMEEFPQMENHESYGIVKLNNDPSKITINLKSPVFINHDKKTGYQKILDEDQFPIDYILFKEN